MGEGRSKRENWWSEGGRQERDSLAGARLSLSERAESISGCSGNLS